MFCKQCGVKNTVGSKFCEACGAKMIIPRQKQPVRKPEAPRQGRPVRGSRELRRNEPIRNHELPRQRRPIEKSKLSEREDRGVPQREKQQRKRKKPLIILLGVLSLVLLLFAGWVFTEIQTTRAFNDAIDEGNRYLLAENLEQAEAHFLRAIEINPREVEPYLQLAEIYMTWDEPEEAIAILEQGLEAVPEEDRPALEKALDEIHEGIRPEPPMDEDLIGEEDGEISPVYLALIAFHELLSNPQTFWFQRWENDGPHETSWNIETIRYAKLIDLRGDGIPQLLLAPVHIGGPNAPPDALRHLGQHFIIFEYTGQIEAIYQSSNSGGMGLFTRYHIADTASGKNYLMVSHIDNNIVIPLSQEETTYLTLDGEEFVQLSFNTLAHYNWEEVNGEWIQEFEVGYVNGQPVNRDSFERAPYEELGIIETRRIEQIYGDVFDVHQLLQYIESRLEAAGVPLPGEARLSVDEHSTLPLSRSMEFYFDGSMGGIASWGTILTLHPDGSFTGHSWDRIGFEPHDLYGSIFTRAEVDFRGRFTNFEQINDFEWSMELEYLTTERPAGEEIVEENGEVWRRIIFEHPIGFDVNQSEYIFIIPGREVTSFPPAIYNWYRNMENWLWNESHVTVPFYLFHSAANVDIDFFNAFVGER